MSVGRCITEQVASRHAENLRDVKESFVKQSTPTVLNMDQHVSGHTRLEGQGLLSEALVHPQLPDPRANLLATLRPRECSLRVSLGGAGGHRSSTQF